MSVTSNKCKVGLTEACACKYTHFIWY